MNVESVSFSTTPNCARPADSCNLASLKNSLVHVISKLHSKPRYYLYLKNRFVAELKIHLDFSLSPLMKGQKEVGNFHRLSSAAQ